MPKTRVCVKCGVEKLLTEIAGASAREHLRGVCFDCMGDEDRGREVTKRNATLVRAKAYRENNRDKILERKKAYRENNRDKVLAQDRASYELHRDRRLADLKAYYELNRERCLARARAWRENNRDKILAADRAHYKLNRERCLAKARAWKAANRDKIADRYKAKVENLHTSYVAERLNLPIKAIPEEIIELKRVQLQITRELRRRKEIQQ